ncbi:bacitracin transport ATP-binding protein BcrA [Thermoclostridium stercorarium subsp. stercorarium DSM 8532]|uniref:Bacitracin transport ATP-binding protein BcrA n=2 Tax=Thermoclostridium stercorarium TaxID=1510 RepID=L7VMW3_THES1|nr:ABC transporter ATP-binding protein [Thermoclostridium stercorarium]AGC67806.1 bacitracin transport ATP-binding protein BcrA [Thermoclostridium stercorarium subsp. stercorarium DSM 8532]AGI38849.1 ABC transporter ATPase subunit [Thermoclostridium stercorarium subsp. stercorarium DSM 8532]ANW98207.1 ABC transporter [Thermoclostridium stercorarium subsp. thermolacticum DSM 2910]
MTEALKLVNVSKHYRDFSLNRINISLPSGCIMGFIGENGAGKTTTIKLILDLIKKDEGKIFVLGKDNQIGLKSLKENIGVVMEDCFFPENLTAANINRILYGIYETWDERKFYSYLKQFSIPANKSIKEYSKGMKMKLSIAAALSHESKLLILDEPTNGLDPVVRDEVLDVFLDFIQDESHSVFISSHIISDLEKICDYITFIHKGSIVFSESKDELLEKYGILKCSEQDFQNIDSDAVVGYRKNSFGVEALVLKDGVGKNFVMDRPSIEDIMLYYTNRSKEKKPLEV